MTPSLRSHPNHPQQPISPPYTRFVRGNGYGSGHWLRHLLAGSPLLQTESGSLSFGTAGLPRAAPHPVSRRRSCLRLLSRCSSRDDSDFHWLISYMCVRTSGVSVSAGIVVRFGSHRQPLQTRAAARFVSWEGSSSTHGAFFNHELLELSRMGLRRYCLTRSGRPCPSLR